MVGISLVFASALSPHADMAACIARVSREASAHFTVVQLTQAGPQKLEAKASLDYRSFNDFDLDLAVPLQRNHGPQHRWYRFRMGVLDAWDRNRDVLTVPIKVAPEQVWKRIQALEPEIPDGVESLRPGSKRLATLWGKLDGLSGWRTTVTGGNRSWVRQDGTNKVVIGFNRSTKTLDHWGLRSGVTSVSWDVSNSVSLGTWPKAMLPKVLQFRAAPLPVKYEDKVATASVNALIAAYDHLAEATVGVVEDSGTTQVLVQGGNFSETGVNGSWTYIGGQLKVFTSKGLFQGTSVAEDLAAHLASVGLPIQPLTLAYARNKNFATTLFGNGYEARQTGTMGEGAQRVTLLQVFGPAVKVRVGLNAAGLIQTVDSIAYTETGQRLAETVRNYSYGPFTEFPTLPTGKYQPLPKLKKPARGNARLASFGETKRP